MGIGQVKENYTNEANASLNDIGIQVSDMYTECIPSHDGEIANCETQGSDEHGRVSYSQYCERQYDDFQFVGIACFLRKPDIAHAGRNSRYGSY